jgi:hypothetical protein
MAVMIKLKLTSPSPSPDHVRVLPGMAGLDLDQRFGVVCISPKQSLYVIRVEAVDNFESRRRASPELLEVYGDVRIGTTQQPKR